MDIIVSHSHLIWFIGDYDPHGVSIFLSYALGNFKSRKCITTYDNSKGSRAAASKRISELIKTFSLFIQILIQSALNLDGSDCSLEVSFLS